MPGVLSHTEVRMGKYTKMNFRVSRTVAMLLTEGFEASPVNPRSDNGGSPAKTAEEHVLTFLWYAANKTCLRDVAERFSLGETTAFRIIERMIEYLREVPKTVILFPADLEQLAKNFEQVLVYLVPLAASTAPILAFAARRTRSGQHISTGT
ncbi:uncharacterized protein LOC144113357 [Amblyomma americanum]